MTMTQQDVIKIFMASLANHGYASSNTVGDNMLDGAIRASSRYSSASDVIAAMQADQVAAEKAAVEEVLGSDYAGMRLAEVPSEIRSADAKTYAGINKSNANAFHNGAIPDATVTVEDVVKERTAYIFLEDYCGIQLENCYWLTNGNVTQYVDNDNKPIDTTGNTDTGAITGSDADGSTTKTAASVVPETYANTYKASDGAAAQTIITNERNWVIQATANDDTITANGADSISALDGNDQITVNASGATVTSGAGNDVITVNQVVNDITLSDLNSDDALTISGEFEIGSAHIEDTLLVVTDKTGTRKIRLGDFDNAQNASIKVNGSASTTIAQWLSKSGIVYDSLSDESYATQVLGNNSAAEDLSGEDEGRIALDDYTPPAVEEPVVQQPNRIEAFGSFNTTNGDGSVTVNLADVDATSAHDVTVNGQVVGAVSSEFPNASTFTRNGLTIHLLGTTTDTSGNPTTVNNASTITPKTFDELTDDQKTIVASLFKWWAGECLTLNEDSYGIGFNSSTAAVKDIGLYFYNGSNNILATVWNWYSTTDGSAVQLMLNVNMNYYSGISAGDMNGISNVNGAGYLDRTLAHEFTHAVMGTNINFFSLLPQFIKEGTAELTHGIDDERGNVIFRLGYDANSLADALNVDNTGTGQGDAYAGGYMFMRYLAKTAAESNLPAFGEITATVDVADDGFYYINGTTTTETAHVAASESAVPTGAIKLGELKNGVYTVNDTGVHQVISGVNQVAGLTVNDTFNGTSGNDTVTTAQGSNIITGGGDDSINLHGQFATINAGAGADTVNVLDGSHHSIDAGDGDNLIVFEPSLNYGNTVTSGTGNDTVKGGQHEDAVISTGAGNDVVSLRSGSDNFVDLGAGNDSILFGGTGNTITGGAGDDTVEQYSNTNGGNVFVFDAENFGNDALYQFKATDKIILGAGFDYSISGNNITVTKGTATVGTINVQTASGVTFDAEKNIVTSHIEIDGLTYNAAGYYEIADAQDLVALATYVNAGNDCRDMTFKVTAAIDMSTVDGNFTPIGKSDKPFAGTFDGDGKTISNLSIDANERCVALFSNLDAGGTIKNVVLSNATVQGTYSSGGYLSALVGGLVSYNNGTVTNCKVDAQLSVNDFNHYGALVCTNHGTVTGNTFHSNIDNAVCFEESSGTASNNTRVYALNAPTGFEISYATCTDESNVVTIGDKTFYKQGAQVTATVTAANDRLDIDGEPSFTAMIGTADATLDVVGFYVQLTAGGESYYNTYSNVSVLGSAGNDIISNEGKNVTIDGGEGNDVIVNSGASVLIDVSKGDDSIKSLFVTEFDVRGFGVGDTIDLIGDVKNLNVVDDKLIATDGYIQFTIGGISAVSTDGKAWALDGNVAKYGDGKTAGAAVSDGKIVFTDATVTDAQVQLGGISNLDGLSVYNNNFVNINASAVAAGGASVVSNSGNYAFYLFDDWNDKTFTGTDNDDNIILDLYATKVSVNAGAGDDTIENYGSNNIIDGGNGSDSIRNDGYNNTITGGAGDDEIVNNGSNVLIDGGADDDTILLVGTTGTTINTAQGNDTIQIYTRNDVNDFTVEGFGVGDVIQFVKFDDEASNYVPVAIESLTTDNGKLVATAGGQSVIIGGINAVPTAGNNLWALDGNVAKYGDGTTAGATIDSGKIIFTNATVTNAQFELGGISNLDGLSIEYNTVNIDASAVSEGGASIVSKSGYYYFKLFNDWKGKTFTGTDNTDAINPDAINIDISAKNVSVNAGAGNDLIINQGKNNTIDGGEGNDEINNIGSNGSIDGGEGNDLIHLKGTGNTVNTAQGDDTIKIFMRDDVNDLTVENFTAGDVIQFTNAYGNATVEVTNLETVDGKLVATAGGRTVTIGGISAVSTDRKAWSLDGNVATYFAGSTSGAYFNGDKIYFRESTIVEQFKLDGISNVDGLSVEKLVDFDAVNIHASVVGDNGASIVSNAGNYAFYLRDDWKGKTFTGTDNTDNIILDDSAKNVSVNAGAGNDTINNYGGSNNTIDGGAGNDYIINNGDNNTIDGGAGDDTIDNWNSNVSIDGGADDDTIFLTGNTTGTTINTAQGNDTIQIDTDNEVNDFTVENFNVGDVIQFIGYDYNDDDPNEQPDDSDIPPDDPDIPPDDPDIPPDDPDIPPDDPDNPDTPDDPENPDTPDDSDDPDDPGIPQEVAVAITSLKMVDGKLVAMSGGQSVIINGLDLSQENAWKLNNNVATYFTGTSEGAYINGDKISFRKADNRVDQVQLGGISNVDGLSIGDNIVNISASAVAAGGASIVSNEGNYNFTLLNNWNGKTFTGSDATDNIILDGSAKNISVDAGDGGDVISNNGTNVSIDGGDGSDNIRNIGDNNTIDGGAGDDYISNIGSNNLIDGGDGNDTIFLAGKTGNIINTAQGNDTIQIDTKNTVNDFTVEGFGVGDAIQFIDGIDPVTITNLETVNGKLVATAGGQSVTINGLDLSQENGWKLDGNTATYFTGSTSGAFIDGDGKISFRAGTDIVNKLVLGGISKAPTLDGNKVELTAYNFAGDTVSVTSNVGEYEFSLSGELDGKTFTGSAGVDKISNAGTSVAINGGAGNDDISNSGNDVTINAGAGNDSIENSSAKVTIDGGAGSNTISLTGNNGTGNVTDTVIKTAAGANTIKVGADMKTFSVDGFGRNDVIELNQLLTAESFNINDEGNLVAGDVTVGGMGTFVQGGGFSATADGSIVYINGTDSVTVAQTTIADNVTSLVYRKDGSALADNISFKLTGLVFNDKNLGSIATKEITASTELTVHGDSTYSAVGGYYIMFDGDNKKYAFGTYQGSVFCVEVDESTKNFPTPGTGETVSYEAVESAFDDGNATGGGGYRHRRAG